MKVKAWFHQPCEAHFYRFRVFFYKLNPNALSEMNQIWNVSRKGIDRSMLKISVLYVS